MSVITLLIITLHLCIHIINGVDGINTISPCIAEYENGSRIDLTSLSSKSGYRWKNKAVASPQDDHWYYYNPCKPFSLGGDVCPENAVCQADSAEQTYYDLGRQDKTVLFSVDDGGNPAIIYQAKDQQRITLISCICVDSETTTFRVIGPIPNPGPPFVYKMELNSSCCCVNGCKNLKPSNEKGLSLGSILLIILLCCVVVYLLVGIAFKFLYHKNESNKMQLIPNVQFWKELPGYIQDGFVFTITSVRTKRTNYNKI